MRFDDEPELYRQMWAFFEAFLRLGFKKDQVFVELDEENRVMLSIRPDRNTEGVAPVYMDMAHQPKDADAFRADWVAFTDRLYDYPDEQLRAFYNGFILDTGVGSAIVNMLLVAEISPPCSLN